MADGKDIWLKVNYWRLAHAKELMRWWVIVFLAIDVFVVVFAATNVGVYLLTSRRNAALILSIRDDHVAYQQLRNQLAPQQLQVGNAQVLASGPGTYDILTRIENPNTQWAASKVGYTVSVDGAQVAEGDTYALAGRTAYVPIFAVQSKSKPNSVQFAITNITWQRVTSGVSAILDDFKVRDAAYVTHAISTGGTSGSVTATVRNQGVHSFWRARFVVLLLNGSTIVGVRQVYIEQFRSLADRPLNVVWTSAPSGASQVQIIPDVNVLDKENFME